MLFIDRSRKLFWVRFSIWMTHSHHSHILCRISSSLSSPHSSTTSIIDSQVILKADQHLQLQVSIPRSTALNRKSGWVDCLHSDLKCPRRPWVRDFSLSHRTKCKYRIREDWVRKSTTSIVTSWVHTRRFDVNNDFGTFWGEEVKRDLSGPSIFLCNNIRHQYLERQPFLYFRILRNQLKVDSGECRSVEGLFDVNVFKNHAVQRLIKEFDVRSQLGPGFEPFLSCVYCLTDWLNQPVFCGCWGDPAVDWVASITSGSG